MKKKMSTHAIIVIVNSFDLNALYFQEINPNNHRHFSEILKTFRFNENSSQFDQKEYEMRRAEKNSMKKIDFDEEKKTYPRSGILIIFSSLWVQIFCFLFSYVFDNFIGDFKKEQLQFQFVFEKNKVKWTKNYAAAICTNKTGLQSDAVL